MFLFLYALVFFIYVCSCEGTGSSRTGVTESCELPCGRWELNPVLLAVEPSVQPQPSVDGYKKLGVKL